MKSNTQTWCCSLLEGQAHRNNRFIASLGRAALPGSRSRGQGLPKRHGQAQLSRDSVIDPERQQLTYKEWKKRQEEKGWPLCYRWIETLILLSFFLITVYFCLDDFYYLLSISPPSRWSSQRPMISIQWDRDVGRWYKAMPRVTTSDLSWAVSMLQQSAFYCALAWSV